MAATLPGAATAPAEFATLFSNASKDPTNNNPQTLLNPFLHNLNDDTNTTSMKNIWDRLAAASHRQFAMAAIISQGQAYLYLLPHHWEHVLAGPEPDLDGKIFAFDQELVKNQGHIVKTPAGVFHLLTNQVMVSMVRKK